MITLLSKIKNLFFTFSKKHKKVNVCSSIKVNRITSNDIKSRNTNCYKDLEKEILIVLQTSNDWVNSTNIIKKISKPINGASLRKIIANLRLKGIPIIASNKGYLISKNKLEIENYIKSRLTEIRYEQKVLNQIKECY